MNLNKISSDDRGEIYSFDYNGEYIIFTIKKGKARGGDYHNTVQHDIILEGKVEYKEGFIDEQREGILTEGDNKVFEEGVPHILIAKEDSLVIEWLEGEFEKEYYEPYRKEVENR